MHNNEALFQIGSDLRERHARKSWTAVHQQQNGISAIPSAHKYPLIDTAELDFLKRIDAPRRINPDPFSGLLLPMSTPSNERDDDCREQENQGRHKTANRSWSLAPRHKSR
jgi:hypothetical protein